MVANEHERRVGDVVHIKAGERHWHGAEADTTMGTSPLHSPAVKQRTDRLPRRRRSAKQTLSRSPCQAFREPLGWAFPAGRRLPSTSIGTKTANRHHDRRRRQGQKEKRAEAA